jgi:lysophospholipase L1-like esterase
MKRLARQTTMLCVCVVGALAALSVPAAATKRSSPAPVKRGSLYLALGDSVTFGYEEAQVVPPPNYRNAASFLGYPEQLGAALHLRVINAACPGETSSSLINASAQSNGCENGTPAYRKLFPLHVRYTGAQLAYGLAFLRTHPSVRLVSLMIGANDLLICQKVTHDACKSSTELNAALAKIAGNVRRILSAVRNKAHYKGQLAIVNYYSLNYASSYLSGISSALNKTADTAAKPFHVVFANGYGELKAAAFHFGGDTCGAGLLTQLGHPGKCGIHPSYAGQALLAQALEKVIQL